MFKDLANLTFTERARIFATPEAAREYIEAIRWNGAPVCPHCGVASAEHYRIVAKKPKAKTRPGLWKCSDCRKQFTVTVGTIFEGSHLPLNKWLYAIFLMCASKKGISANQLARDLEVTYKSAWFLCHRIRKAMEEIDFPAPNKTYSGSLDKKLSGIVEADETHVGGKKRGIGKGGYRRAGEPRAKAVVFTLVSRDGQARSFHVDSTTAPALQGIIARNVEGEAHLMTDEMHSYWGARCLLSPARCGETHRRRVRPRDRPHELRESFFSLLKRAIVGAFHHVSKKHRQRYLEEFDLRRNRRDGSDSERMLDVIKGSEVKRLFYRWPKRPVHQQAG